MHRSFRIFFSFVLVAGLSFAFPGVSLAGATITEIMYDLPGTDTGREWIEAHNTGSGDVSLLKWKLFEANTNHGLTLFQGSATTSADGFAIIADDPAKFLLDNPTYSGTLYKSSFSLSNTGETLELRLDGVAVSQATYASSAGAAGDGNSLHRVGNEWQATTPTPGSGASTAPPPPNSQQSAASTSTTPESEPEEEAVPAPTTTQSGSTWTFKPQVFVKAFVQESGVAGAPITFDAAAVGTKKEPLLNARYLWSFGDGGTLEGKKVQHTYHYPAVYTVLVDAASGEWNATDRKEIIIVAPALTISSIKEGGNGFIEIKNNGKFGVDLSSWLLVSASGLFTIPKGTLIGAHKSIPFPAAITNLSADPLSTSLLYPNGSLVTRYGEAAPVPLAAAPIPVAVQAEPPKVQPVRAEVAPIKPEPEPVPPKKETPVVKAEKDVLPEPAELLGAAFAAEPSSLPWMLGTALLVAVALGGYMTMLRSRPEPSAAEKLRKEAATYDIIE